VPEAEKSKQCLKN
jgi:hypothetical protein